MCFIIISVLFVCVTTAQNISNYTVPDVTVQALKPNGFRIFIPGDSRIKLFHFEANFYLPNNTYYMSLREFVVQETKGYWMYENRITPLKVGYTVVYYIFVSFKKPVTDKFHWVLNGSGYNGQGQHKITKEDVIEHPDNLKPLISTNTETCKKTFTKLVKGKSCSGQTIFEDHFDTFREDLWQIEQYIPQDDPYHPFISYQNIPSNPTIFVEDGLLIIEPKLQQNLPGFTNKSILYGKLDLQNGCTGQICVQDAGVLPPIASGKLTAKMAFTYGIVEVRAKMPIGDWLYPEIQLQSFTNKYGKLHYASGVLKIALVFGNKESNDTYSNKFLGGSALLNTDCFPNREHVKKISNGTWSDDFHVYSLKWTPDRIELYVDGEMWDLFKPGRKGLRSWLPLNCRKDWFELLGRGDKMAPFDHHFYLTLGVAAGGSLFPDNITGSAGAKPWRNKERKALPHFLKDLPNWYPTWTQALLIDYVKIKAL